MNCLSVPLWYSVISSYFPIGQKVPKYPNQQWSKYSGKHNLRIKIIFLQGAGTACDGKWGVLASPQGKDADLCFVICAKKKNHKVKMRILFWHFFWQFFLLANRICVKKKTHKVVFYWCKMSLHCHKVKMEMFLQNHIEF